MQSFGEVLDDVVMNGKSYYGVFSSYCEEGVQVILKNSGFKFIKPLNLRLRRNEEHLTEKIVLLYEKSHPEVCIGAMLCDLFCPDETEVYVSKLEVLPDYRGNEIAKVLVALADSLGIRYEKTRTTLVSMDEGLMPYYESMGFKPVPKAVVRRLVRPIDYSQYSICQSY